MATLIIVLLIAAAFCYIATGTPLVRTYPRQRWYFDVLDWLLWPIMRWFGTRKLTHTWHWKKLVHEGHLISDISALMTRLDNVHMAIAFGDKSAPEANSLICRICADLSGWKTCVQLSTYDNSEWLLGFYSTAYKSRPQLCTVVCMGAVLALTGPDTTRFFAFDMDMKPIDLFVERYCDRVISSKFKPLL